MEQRGIDAVARIQQQYGGVLELCRRLYTSPTEGIHTAYSVTDALVDTLVALV